MDQHAGDASSAPIVPKTTEIEEILDEVDIKFRDMKKFDRVSGPSDHHYLIRPLKSFGDSFRGSNRANIKSECAILEEKLNSPGNSSIYVRVYQEWYNADLMRAVVVGPRGTPFCYGLFFFDIWFPPNYPVSPPKFYYRSGGYDLNPNLGADGRVRLGLLKTLSEDVEDQWIPYKSNVLEVLRAIQTSVFCAEPYFNNPEVKHEHGKPLGEINSRKYNDMVFVLSCRKMLDVLFNPPNNFEDFVKGHFRCSSHYVLRTCNEYINHGADMGNVAKRLYKKFEANGSYCRPFKCLLEMENKEVIHRDSKRQESRGDGYGFFKLFGNLVNVEGDTDGKTHGTHIAERCYFNIL